MPQNLCFMPKYVQLEVHGQEFDVLPLYFWIDRSYFRPPLLKSTFLTKKYRKSAILKSHFFGYNDEAERLFSV